MATAVNKGDPVKSRGGEIVSVPAVSVRDVSLTFAQGANPVQVLEKVSIDVWPGEFVCIVGPSGCGKTTLLNIIGGFQKPSQGEVFAKGSPVLGPDPRRIFIFQEGGVFPWLSVAENVGFGLSGRVPAERAQIVKHYIDMVGLNGFEKAYPRSLSGGMRQRVEIARALAAGPEVIYMDEPFGALDFFTRMKMRNDLIKIWQKEQKTILFVTHDIEEALQLADRVAVMGRRPSRMQSIVTVDLPRPRDLNAAQYLAKRDEILEILGFHHSHGQSLRETGFHPHLAHQRRNDASGG